MKDRSASLFLPAIFIFFLDQFTKHLALRFLTMGMSVPVLPRVFQLTLVENQGIAFGILDDHGSFLLVAITACIIFLIVYSLRSPPAERYAQIAYGFILGGAVGNLLDRIRLGHVVDFLDFRIWPVFNFADSFITIGVSIFILHALKKSPPHAP